jgi:hypothetical protein
MTTFENHELIGIGILYALIIVAVMVAVWAIRRQHTKRDS